jgi:hypothetical protein
MQGILSISLMRQGSGHFCLVPPLYWMKHRHELYWTYNPRGRDASITVDSRYCPHCRCPNHYCAEVTFGDIIYNHVVYLIVELGDEASVFDFYIKHTFKWTYTRLVHAKMMENRVSFPGGFDFKKPIELPKCIVDGSLKTMLKDYE